MTAAEQGAAVDGPNVADVLAALNRAVISGRWDDWQATLRMFRQAGGAGALVNAEVSRQVAAREAEAVEAALAPIDALADEWDARTRRYTVPASPPAFGYKGERYQEVTYVEVSPVKPYADRLRATLREARRPAPEAGA